MVFHTSFHRNVKYYVKEPCEIPVKRAPHFHLVFHRIRSEIPCEKDVKHQ